MDKSANLELGDNWLDRESMIARAFDCLDSRGQPYNRDMVYELNDTELQELNDSLVAAPTTNGRASKVTKQFELMAGQGFYGRLSLDAITDVRLNNGDRTLLALLDNLSAEDGYCYFSEQTLARLMPGAGKKGVTVKTLHNSLQRLDNNGNDGDNRYIKILTAGDAARQGYKTKGNYKPTHVYVMQQKLRKIISNGHGK